jgi:DNA polymerase (family 10)
MSDSDQNDSHERSTDNAEIARVLQQIADMLEFKNENPFKFRSYQMAAETIGSMGTPLTEIVARGGSGELQKIPGIGKTISTQILEIVQTGKSSYFEELTRDVPATVLDLRQVTGIGLKTAQLLYRDFGVESLDQLRSFAERGGLSSVPGLGEKTAMGSVPSVVRVAPAPEPAPVDAGYGDRRPRYG